MLSERFSGKSRRARGVSAPETIIQDLRYAIRGMRHSPAFAVLTLWLATGAMANRIWALVLTPLLVAELLQVTPSGLSVEPRFATVAEGFTSESERDGVQVAFRMFSLPDFETCAATPKPSRLIAITTPIEIRLGEPFALSRIVVVARDSRGSLLRQVPIALEVEDIGLFNLRSNAIAESKLEPLRPGRLRFRARTVCPGISISTVIPATIW